ncbi:MAG: RDD family protein [Amaricoccus sp.]|uniref:RDD family protein n=1 Tax=Amaricoccus sp. TaxID=1872485 RepID=UPI0039E6DA4E
MYASFVHGPMAGLPDPAREPEFYRGVPARRFFAWLIDVVVVLAVGVPLAVVFGVFTLGFGFVLFPAILTAVAVGYRTWTLAGGSATWGMRFCGIEFRRGDGTRFDLMTAALHTLIQTVAFGFFVLQVLSCVTILGTRYGQSLPDLILGTTALHRPVD